jgi:hypothetical protein
MINALLAKPARVTFRGEVVTLRRPTVADLVALMDASERGVFIPAWYVLNHVLDGDQPAFESMDQVMRLDAIAVTELSRLIDAMYGEGQDLPRAPAKSCEAS